ncbi:amino acid adenylation domain-containing protein [Cyanobium sp. ATX 6A2]|uniref:amino acid adenylation domain-containing protein n=1 Tax=Cyanobium sp. ATX 6A2 TaxID=2823700 RepID=UPI0020CB8486|nr:amino acid adenylation domain-containing protein [Cyanobium sp. ATX 6A2]MCP9888743.1 amino acid adenylation domain-containing protein [Cyanobium sp. ATX 6A2]
MSGSSQSSRLERLRRLASFVSAAPGRSAATPVIPAAEPLAGDWPAGCQAYQASFAQSRLWLLQQLQPELTTYHMPALWRLRGELDVQALHAALVALSERHPTLCTSFRLEQGKVLQILHPSVAFPLTADTLGGRNAEEVIKGWLEEERSTPFDLASGVLLRARLLAVDDQEHVLLLNHHHIASDGWSLSVLHRDLIELYNAHHSNRSPQLPPLTVHYQDYAAWQRERLGGQRLQQLKDYWMPQLIGLQPLELPWDHTRPASPSYVGGRVSFRIEAELLRPFEELCRTEGATLQMGLLALVALLLHRYSRQDDFAIGVPIWGRNHPDLEPLIGFFINTLPIRTRFQREQSFRELLRQVKDTSVQAYEHEELPFEQMVEALQMERDTSRNPLVQVILQLMELPDASLQGMEGLQVEQLAAKGTASKVDLSFQLCRTADQGLQGTVSYTSDLFEAERIERLTTHLQTLLASLLEAPDAPAGSMNLMPEAERQLIESWQQGPEIEVPDLCLHELFEQQVERTPDAIALIFQVPRRSQPTSSHNSQQDLQNDIELTYADLNIWANVLSWKLIDCGAGPGDIVALELSRPHHWIVATLACLKAGSAFLAIDSAWPVSRKNLVSDDASPRLRVVDDDQAEDRIGILAMPLYPSLPAASAPSGRNPSIPVDRNQLAYVVYTSGSAGAPKGVLIEHGGLLLRGQDLLLRWDLGLDRRVLCNGSFSFDMTLRTTLIPLAAGASVVVATLDECQDPRCLIGLIHRAGCDRLSMSSSQWQAVFDAGFVPSIPTHAFASAEPLTADLAGKFPLTQGHRLTHTYGPTETTIYSTTHDISVGQQAKLAPIGVPLPETVTRVLDGSGHPCPIGIPGELHIGGKGLARGYLNNPELTAEKFIPDPFSSDPVARLYKSGDLASWNPDGTLAFHGRIDHQIKLRGFRIEPGEIEVNLLEHPGVSQAVVVLRQDDPVNPRLIGYWVGEATTPSSPSATSEQLRSFLAKRLPDYMVPSAFVQLEALPLTSNGKLDRRALPAPSFASDSQQRVEPASELERTLHGIWVEVLGHEEFGITDNFFQIGGHSLAAARLVSRIEQTFGRALALAAVFQHPTIAGLVALPDRGEWVAEKLDQATAIQIAAPIQLDLP